MENKAISSDLIRGHIDTIILYSLTDCDKHAQQISDYVAEKSNDEYQINQATLYSSLKRLESLKYVSAYWHSAETGRRRYFKITELGRQISKENTDNWSYSRSIIDRLINCEPTFIKPEPEIITKYVEKPVVIYKNVNENLSQNDDLTKNVYQCDQETPKNQEISVINQEKTEEKITYNPFNQGANFRLVLSDLIKSTEKQKNTQKQQILIETQENKQENTEIPAENNVAKFNETISEDFKYSKTASNNIDFSDIIDKGEKEGYKVNVSSSNKPVKFGSVFINKVRLFASASLFLLVLLEMLLLITLSKSIINFNTVSILIPVLIMATFPIVCIYNYLRKPSQTSCKIKKDSILTYGIIIFNLVLFTFVLNLLFETDFYQTKNVILYVLTPSILYLDVFLYSVIKYVISNKKQFVNKK